ncbi:MAG: glycoside hydrolase family 65 protein [Oscillospiraceae bacterium]|jgi:alpha,alpha-trehalose phosphorylase|nr:glycoside hydrolase family 65 protein [Oscillospiraceae bacterium]
MNGKKQPIYPVEPWSVTETSFDTGCNYRNETAFSLSNGYIGTRGTFEEGYDFPENTGLEGNYINGFYESAEIRYGEWNFGFPERSQSLLNLPNLKTTRIFLGGEAFDMRKGVIRDYRRTLDMRSGILTRSLIWESPGGKRARVETQRFVSLAVKHIMVQRVFVTPLNFDGEVRILSVLDADVENHTRAANPLVDYGPFGRTLVPDEISAENDTLFYAGHTANSGMKTACGCFHKLTGAKIAESYETDGLSCRVEYVFQGAATMEKFIVYASSLDSSEDGLSGFARGVLEKAANDGYDALSEEQKARVRSFWETADVEIDGDDAIQQGLRFNLFHLMQSANRDGNAGMGAKGLSGEGYEGHYFWDTEIYVLPVFTHTFPDITKSLLDYRFNTLDAARLRARELGHGKGALYPWRTINGFECSAYLPLGTAQYHINADIAYAFSQYVKVAGDTDYLKEKAAEVLCETARVWADVGCFSEARGGKYCICSVTGPDEYTALVDNNFYTNLMAYGNLWDAADAVRWLEKNDGDAFRALTEKIELSPDEPKQWEKIASEMYLPFDEKEQVYLQDDGFLLRKPWDDSLIPPEKRRLLYENYHPLFIWRQRMAKQADTVLAMLLHSEYFDRETIERHYDYYGKVTLHHSSLSKCVFGIIASLIGKREEAYRCFNESARMDIDDYHGNFYAGIHTANMAGSWLSVVYGFAGLNTGGGKLKLSPFLPEAWRGYRFRLSFGGRRFEISVKKSGCFVRQLSGEPLDITIYGKIYRLDGEGDFIKCANTE